ncbi:MAG TPA: hypothetical protein VFB82_23005 [Blastocatellia bacterium]|jgi:hypothetical protein|nr:hypothetical protein [Blastocatellia bacterium]
MILMIVLGVLTTAVGVGFGWSVLELTMRALERSFVEERTTHRIPWHRGTLRNRPLA